MLAFLAQIPTSRNLDNPCTLCAKIGDARRLQDAAVECRGYRAVVEAVSHKLRHTATRRSDEARPVYCGRWAEARKGVRRPVGMLADARQAEACDPDGEIRGSAQECANMVVESLALLLCVRTAVA